MAQHTRKREQGPWRSEEYYRALIENAMDVITVLDADGAIRYASPAIERVLGYAPEQRVGKRIHAFIHPDDLAVIEAALSGALRNCCNSTTMEFRFRHQDGSWRILEATARNLLHNRWSMESL